VTYFVLKLKTLHVVHVSIAVEQVSLKLTARLLKQNHKTII